MALLLPFSTQFLEDLTYDIDVLSSDESSDTGEPRKPSDLNLQKLKEQFDLVNLKKIMASADADQCFQIDFQEMTDCSSANFEKYHNTTKEKSSDFDQISSDFQEIASIRNNMDDSDSDADTSPEVTLLNKKAKSQGIIDKILLDSGNSLILKMYTYQQAVLTTQVFRFAMICSTFLVCLSHGCNDVGNAISPLYFLVK